MLDCIIIGGGPDGLTAALYLTRFRREIRVIDAGESRAAWIPASHNQPLFPEGITGAEILRRMRQHLTRLGIEILAEKAAGLAPIAEGFLVDLADETAAARTILLATGVVNHKPDMSAQLHRSAVAAGLIRYCPVCDGFEAKGLKIAVLGKSAHGVREALFLRTYSQNVTLFCNASTIDQPNREWLAAAGITLVKQPIARLAIDQGKIFVETELGARHPFDTLYPALGSHSNVDLLLPLGASMSSQGWLLVDSHQMTNVAGIYAAGDVVQGLDQISVALRAGCDRRDRHSQPSPRTRRLQRPLGNLLKCYALRFFHSGHSCPEWKRTPMRFAFRQTNWH